MSNRELMDLAYRQLEEAFFYTPLLTFGDLDDLPILRSVVEDIDLGGGNENE